MGRGVGGPEGVKDGAEGGFVVAAGFLEAGEVVRTQEELAGGVHGVKIQRGVAAEPGCVPQKRVFLPVNEVGIFPPAGTEAGVEIVRDGRD